RVQYSSTGRPASAALRSARHGPHPKAKKEIAPMSLASDHLLDKIHSKRACVGVVGLGYVGLPLAVELARAGFDTTGIDVDPRKTDATNSGDPYSPDVASAEAARLGPAGRLHPTSDSGEARPIDSVYRCVPPPLR